MMNNSLWIIVFFISVLLEALSTALLTIWFAIGSLLSFIFSILGCSFKIQVIVFFITSILLLLFFRSYFTKILNKSRTKTNTAELIGQTGIITEEIQNIKNKGRILINGQDWAAKMIDEKVGLVGSNVEVIEISGVKLVVKEKKE